MSAITEHRPSLPEAPVHRRKRWSPIWLVPIVAIGVAIYLTANTLSQSGPTITLTFVSAAGLAAGETQVKHKGVTLGTVGDISLARDMSHVIVTVKMAKTAEPLLTDHARFWVVRPRLTGSSVAGIATGLETLVSGGYIQVDPGPPGGKEQTHFEGLEDPPGVRSDEPGLELRLEAKRLGSIATGAPLFYRDVTVGEVLGYDLGDGLGPVSLRVFVRAPFDKFVRTDSRFWNASGVTATMGAGGLRLEMESIQAVLSGGIEFESPPRAANVPPAPPAKNGATYQLFDSEADADSAAYHDNIPCVTYFDGTVDGLVEGAAVQLVGAQVGVVREVKPVLGPKGRWVGRVTFALQPERVATDAKATDAFRASLEDKDLHVVLTTSNLLTGQKVLELTYGATTTAKRGAGPTHEGDALVLPGEAGNLDDLTTSLGEIAAKINKMPIEGIGEDLDTSLKSLSKTLADADQLVQQANAGLGPAMSKLPQIADQLQQAAEKANHTLGEGGYGANSEVQRGLVRLLSQVTDAARSMRLLVEFLDRHPEALIRGRDGSK